MPEYKFVIPGEMTDFNTYSTAERTHRNKGAKIKEEETNRVWAEAKAAKLPTIEIYPLRIDFKWYCKNQKKDPDNISAAKKFILDGLQVANVLANDGWKQIAGFSDSFHIDADNPRVEITISVVL